MQVEICRELVGTYTEVLAVQVRTTTEPKHTGSRSASRVS